MNKTTKIIFLVLVFLFSNSAWSQINEADLPTADQLCPLSPSHQILSCKGSFTANTEAELDTYLQTVGFHNGFARHLRINFNVNRTDLSIATPCRVIMEPGSTITTTQETFCVNAHKGFRSLGSNKLLVNEAGAVISSRDDAIIFRENSEIDAGDILFTAKNQIVIHDNPKLRVDGVLILRSTGQSDLARVHIRHKAQVEAVNLLLIANHIATIGHTSQYLVQDLLELRSPQAEASSIWYDTKINAGQLKINSGIVARLGARVEINAGSVDLDATECKIAGNAVITAPQKLGNCFSGQHPTARMLTSDLRGQGSLNVNFDVGRSTYGPSGFDRADWRFEQTSPLVPMTAPEANYFYEYPGIYFAEFFLYNQMGLRDSVRRRIDVDEVSGPGAPTVSYRYTIDQSDPDLVHFELLAKPTPGSFIQMAKYIINNEEEIIADGTTYKSKTSYRFEERKVHKVKVIAVDNFGRSHSFERNLNLTLPEHRPVIDVDIVQVAPKKLFVDLHRSFGVHGGLSGGTIFWGDGARTELSSTFGVHTYQNAGSYELRVRLEDSSGLIAGRLFLVDVTEDNGVQLNPVANFEVEELSFAQGFKLYVDQSGTPNGEIVQALWNFGDGTTGQGMEVVHFYEPGVYNVSLTVTDALGLSDSQVQQIVVHGGSPLVANLNCWSEGQTANCNWSALDSMKNLTEVKIDWGDGIVEEMALTNTEFMIFQNVGHTYAQGGSFNVTITVKNGTGQSVTSSQNLSVNNIFQNVGVNCQQDINLVNCYLSIPNEVYGLISEAVWETEGQIFAQSPQIGFSRTYANEGQYLIKLSVRDQQNALYEIDTFEFEIGSITNPANLPPVADGQCTSIEIRSVTCDSFSYDSDGTVVEHRWEFEEGVSVVGQSANHTYSSDGNVQIKLTVTDNEGAEDEKIFTVDLQSAPFPDTSLVSDFGGGELQLGQTVNYSFTEGFGSEVVSQSWLVDEVQVSTDREFSFTPTSAGSFVIRLETVNNWEKTKSESVILAARQNQSPIAMLSCSSENLYVYCFAQGSFDSDGFISQYRFNMGDGTYYEGSNGVSHLYTQASQYIVTLEVIDNEGAVGSTSVQATTTNPPIEEPDPLTLSAQCSSDEFREVYCEAVTNRELVSFNWSMGDGTSLSSDSVTHQYATDNDPTIEVTATDTEGESVTQTIEVVLKKAPSIYVLIGGIESESVEPGTSLSLTGDRSYSLGTNGQRYEIVSYEWRLNGQVVSSSAELELNLTSRGLHELTLVVETELGFSNSSTRTIMVSHAPIAEITTSNTSGEISLEVSVSASNSSDFYNEGLSYLWKLDGEEFTGVDQVFTISKPGNYLLELIVANQDGVTDSDNIRLSATPDEVYLVEAETDLLVRAGTVFNFEVPLLSNDINGDFEYIVDMSSSNMLYSIDEEEKMIEFLPLSEHEGEIEFSLLVRHVESNKEFERNYKIIVLNYVEILRSPVLGASQKYYPQFTEGHALEGIEIELPGDLPSGFELIFEEAGGSADSNERPIISIRSTVDSISPFVINNVKEDILIGSKINNFSIDSRHDFNEGLVFISSISNSYSFCSFADLNYSDIPILYQAADANYRLNTKKLEKRSELEDIILVDGDQRLHGAYVSKSMFIDNGSDTKIESTDLVKLRSVFKSLKGLDMYPLYYSSLPFNDRQVLGFVAPSLGPLIILNKDSLYTNLDKSLEFTHRHEAFHLKQYEVLKCEAYKKLGELTWIMETSATHIAIKNIENEESVDWITNTFHSGRQDYINANSIFDISADRVYSSYFIWDYLPQLENGIQLLSKIGEKEFSFEKSGADLLFEYMDLISADTKRSFLNELAEDFLNPTKPNLIKITSLFVDTLKPSRPLTGSLTIDPNRFENIKIPLKLTPQILTVSYSGNENIEISGHMPYKFEKEDKLYISIPSNGGDLQQDHHISIINYDSSVSTSFSFVLNDDGYYLEDGIYAGRLEVSNEEYGFHSAADCPSGYLNLSANTGYVKFSKRIIYDNLDFAGNAFLKRVEGEPNKYEPVTNFEIEYVKELANGSLYFPLNYSALVYDSFGRIYYHKSSAVTFQTEPIGCPD